MSAKSKIEWTDATWTPIRARNRTTGKVGWYCEHATPGCVNCYAESMNARLGTGLPFKPGHRTDVELFLDEEMLTAPLRWKRPRMVFVCSMTDLFADFVPGAWIDRVFAVMALAPQHTFQVLTKRAERMRAYFDGRYLELDPRAVHCARAERVFETAELHHSRQWYDRRAAAKQSENWPLPNVWLGVSAEDQRRADERIPHLLATPAAVRFISAEPLLGPIDLTKVRGSINVLGRGTCPSQRDANGYHSFLVSDGLDWVIAGGESGRGARPMHPDWVRALRDQCEDAGVAFFFKQWGEWPPYDRGRADSRALAAPGSLDAPVQRFGKKLSGRLLDGVEYNGLPQVRP